MAEHKRLWDDPANVLLLGTMPDSKLARQLAVGQSTVRMARVRRGIPVFVPPERKPPGRKPIELPQHITAKLGLVGDAALAAQAGVSEIVIRRARNAAGIPPFGPVNPPRQRIEPASLPQPTPQAIAAAREAAGHNLTQAAALARLGSPNWGKYEAGKLPMDPARWELYLLMTGQHPTLRVIPKDQA